MAANDGDIEMDAAEDEPKAFVAGFPSLAGFIARDEDRATSIFRSFRRISTRNLLFMEAELADLEERLDALDKQDRREGINGMKFARSWKLMSESDHPRQVRKKELIQKIRMLVKEYCMSIVRQKSFMS
jgi:hypothetical protein